MQYLKECAKNEKYAIVNFINEVKKAGTLPKGTGNNCINPKLTSTPKFKQIKSFQKKGIIL